MAGAFLAVAAFFAGAGAFCGVPRRAVQASSTLPSMSATEVALAPCCARHVSRIIVPFRTHCIIHWEFCAFALTRP